MKKTDQVDPEKNAPDGRTDRQMDRRTGLIL